MRGADECGVEQKIGTREPHVLCLLFRNWLTGASVGGWVAAGSWGGSESRKIQSLCRNFNGQLGVTACDHHIGFVCRTGYEGDVIYQVLLSNGRHNCTLLNTGQIGSTT